MLTPFDDYPVHQTALPLAQAGEGNPNFYDRFWFNGYTEDFFFAVAMGLYPNRGVIDAAFSVVANGEQRSVFASGRAPFDRSETKVGPITIEIVEPMRRGRVVVNAPEQGLVADLSFTARTPVFEEDRQTRFRDNRLAMDVTRATQWGTWSGTITSNGHTIDLSDLHVFGTKDRSWGVRDVGQPTPAAPIQQVPQAFFIWAPINFDDGALHFMAFEDELGARWSETGAKVPVLAPGDPVTDSPFAKAPAAHELKHVEHPTVWESELRKPKSAALTFEFEGEQQRVDLDPLFTFRMSGAGYMHPKFSHGTWIDELVVEGEAFKVEELDNAEFRNLHIQQVVRATWPQADGTTKIGLGTLEHIVIGPHKPSGFVDLLGPAQTIGG